jgi:flagellar biosynthesis component FlhA
MLDEVPMVMHSLSDQDGHAGRSTELFVHLERFIRQNLASFITLQSVESRLRTEWSDRAGEIAEDAGRLARLTRLLRSLVQERIPVLALPGICEAMLQGIAAREDQDRILAAVRLLPALLPHLDPGEQAPLYVLGPSIERVIMDGLTPYGDERLLLLEPEPTQDILREVRNGLEEPPEHESPAILLVEDPICRRYVRRLVELEFPHLVVLARPELPAGREDRVVATLDLE